MTGHTRRARSWTWLAAAALLAGTAAAGAHHSFTGAYNVNETITIEGTIIQIALRSPHSFFYVESTDEKGETRQWAIEGASAGQFAQQGVDSQAFRVGDEVTVTANPSRTPNSTRARLITIVRPSDGKTWGTQAGETVD